MQSQCSNSAFCQYKTHQIAGTLLTDCFVMLVRVPMSHEYHVDGFVKGSLLFRTDVCWGSEWWVELWTEISIQRYTSNLP